MRIAFDLDLTAIYQEEQCKCTHTKEHFGGVNFVKIVLGLLEL